MKRVLFIASAAVLLVAPLAFTQPPGGQGQKIGLATTLQRGYAGFKTNFTAAAERKNAENVLVLHDRGIGAAVWTGVGTVR